MRARSGWSSFWNTYLETWIILRNILTQGSQLIRANIPDATYLVWLDCRKLNMTDQELKEFMIRKAGLGLNPGSDFTRAMSGFMRLNAACPRATLEKALGQLERAVNELAH